MTGLAEEDQPDLASHVKSSEECCNAQQPVNERIAQAGIQQNFILRPEPCKGDNARQRQRPGHVEPVGGRHGLAKPAHVAHVIRVEYFAVPLGVRFSLMFLFLTCTCLSLFILPRMSMLCMMMPALHAQNDRTGREK